MLLSLLVFVPLIGAAIVLIAPESLTRVIALAATAITLVVALLVVMAYDGSSPSMQLIEQYSWIPAFHIGYTIGIDGLSFPMVVLTALLSFICIIASWTIEKQIRGYFALFLLLQSSMTGVFVSLDLFLFYVFWELMLLPMYFLIGIWGAPSRVDDFGRTRGGPYAAIKFFLYTLVGSLLMLVAILYLWNDRGTFDLRELAGNPDRALRTQIILWTLFFIAFAVKIPMFPFHTWLPDAHVEAPTAVSVILAGVLLKMGTYGILRINYPLFPGATVQLASAVALFGVINIIYGALCAMAQKDMKRLVAYSSISHMGYVMLGMGSFFMLGSNRQVDEALLGGVLQMWNHGTITAMLFLLVGVIYDRAHHRNIDGFGGLAVTMPVYTGWVALAFFASLGLPGLSGFVGEALTLLGTWRIGGYYRIFVLCAAFGIIITAAYHLWLIQRAFLGKENPKCASYPDMSLREKFMLAPLGAIVIWIGVYPAPMLNVLKATLTQLSATVLKGGM